MARSADDRRAANERGAAAEAFVADQLRARGWTVLARNWRGGGGELDIVVVHGGVLRFVEVKLRQVDDLVGLESIGRAKQRRLARAAEAYLIDYGDLFDEVAFMAVLVEGDQVTWIDNAFDV